MDQISISLKSILTSRRAWAIVGAILVTLYSASFKLNADQTQLIVSSLLAWAGFETVRSSKDGSSPLFDLLRDLLPQKPIDPPQS